MRQNVELIDLLQREKGYTRLEAVKAEYQMRLFVKELICTTLLLGIAVVMGKAVEFLIVAATMKLVREQSGGIHLSSSMKCFIGSMLMVFSTIFFVEIISTNSVIKLFLIIYIIVIHELYIPGSTSARPITKSAEIKQRKNNLVVFISLICLASMVSSYIAYYDVSFKYIKYFDLMLLSTAVVYSLSLPVLYKICRVKKYRDSV